MLFSSGSLFADPAVQSSQWYAWGPPNMQCRLCASCWNYWKKYGGLKTPTHLDGTARASSVSPAILPLQLAPDVELWEKTFHKTWHLPFRNTTHFMTLTSHVPKIEETLSWPCVVHSLILPWHMKLLELSLFLCLCLFFTLWTLTKPLRAVLDRVLASERVF